MGCSNCFLAQVRKRIRNIISEIRAREDKPPDIHEKLFGAKSEMIGKIRWDIWDTWGYAITVDEAFELHRNYQLLYINNRNEYDDTCIFDKYFFSFFGEFNE